MNVVYVRMRSLLSDLIRAAGDLSLAVCSQGYTCRIRTFSRNLQQTSSPLDFTFPHGLLVYSALLPHIRFLIRHPLTSWFLLYL